MIVMLQTFIEAAPVMIAPVEARQTSALTAITREDAARRLGNECDVTKCLKNGLPDDHCCAWAFATPGCADGYTMTKTTSFLNNGCGISWGDLDHNEPNTCCEVEDFSGEVEDFFGEDWFKDLGGGSLVGGIFALIGIILGVCVALAAIKALGDYLAAEEAKTSRR